MRLPQSGLVQVGFKDISEKPVYGDLLDPIA
jgi:hypothetical protein